MPRGMPLALFALLLGLTARAAIAASDPKVERIGVRLESTSYLSGVMRARIEASVARVAERMVAGRPIAQVEEARSEYEGIIAEVFARILTGYRVEGVELAVGPETRVTLRLSPEGARVGSVRFSARLSGLSDPARTFFERDLAASYDSFAGIFTDVPVAAFAWAEPILTAGLMEAFGARFPGFRLEVVLTPAPILEVELQIAPALPVVEGVEVEITSRSLPRIVVARWAERARTSCAVVAGLPLAYVRRHQTVFEERCAELLGAEDISRRLNLVWRVRLNPGTTTRARIEVEAERYSLEIAGRFVLGDETVLGARARAGIRPLPRWEFAGELGFDTGGRGMNLSASVVYATSPDLSLGFTRLLGTDDRLLWLRYATGPRDFFALEGDLVTGTLSASMAFALEEGLAVVFKVDSARRYRLAFEVYL